MNRTCLRCNASLEGKRPNAKYCSKTCKSTASSARCEARGRGENIPFIEFRKPRGKCLECGQLLPTAQHLYFCSNECRANSYLSKCTDLVLWQPKPKSAPKQYAPAPRSFVMGYCQECAEQFTQVRRGNMKPATYCSDRCARRAAWRDQAHIRRARIKHSRRGNVYRRAILERDNYTCKLCNEPVDMTAHYNDNAYPSLDHIIPLARGGWHGMDNIQTAHRICNSIKNDSLQYAS